MKREMDAAVRAALRDWKNAYMSSAFARDLFGEELLAELLRRGHLILIEDDESGGGISK